MRFKKFVTDYTFKQVIVENGRKKTITDYIGPAFVFSAEPEKLHRSKMICAVLAACCVAAVLVPLLVISPIIHCWYAMVPLILALIAVLNLSMCVGRALTVKSWVTRKQKDRITERLAPWSLVLIILSALSAIGQVVYYSISDHSPKDIPVTIATAVLLAASVSLFCVRDFFAMKETEAK